MMSVISLIMVRLAVVRSGDEVLRRSGVETGMRSIQEERISQLNDKDVQDGDYVLYWMQEAQRASYNHALEYAVQRANELEQPLLVVFGLTADYPEANLRQYAFMLEGLKDAGEALEERGIQLAVYLGSPDEVALRSGENASMIVCDMSYLRLQQEWRERLAKEARCLVLQVETEVVVPVELASNKREHAARTLRPRIREQLDDFLVELEPTALDKPSLDIETSGLDLSDIGAILDGMELDRTVPPVIEWVGTTAPAFPGLVARTTCGTLRPLLAPDVLHGKAHRRRCGRGLGIKSTAALLLPSPRWSEQGILPFYSICR
jgi:hypothetical protein